MSVFAPKQSQSQVQPVPEPAALSLSLLPLQLRRVCACGGSCEKCRTGNPGDEPDTLRAKSGPAHAARAGAAPPIVHNVLRSPGEPLPAAARAFMEPRFGHDFSQVRIHRDSLAAESARVVNALAYTVGNRVVFGAGQYAPETHPGARLLAHELAHTVQNPSRGHLLPFLTIGPVDDPAERDADRSADAVMAGNAVALSPMSHGVLRRQRIGCTAEAATREDQRIVKCPDGDFRVTLTTSSTPSRPETRTSVNAGYNDTSIFLNIDVCRGGTDVRVTPTVDLPRAVGQAIGNVIARSDVLNGVTLSPGIDITIVQSDSFTLSLSPKVKVDETGVIGGSVGGTVTTPRGTIRGDVAYDSRNRSTSLVFTITPGKPTRHVDCRREGRTRLVFNCEKITHHEGKPEVPLKTEPEEEVRYIFFEYPTAKIRKDFRLPADIESLNEMGYRIKSIEGFTSPEGPRQQETPNFEGNIKLSEERADAALNWIKEVCPGCDVAGVKPVGRSELPPLQGATEPEGKGPAMERSAVEEFLGNTPGSTRDPLAPSDPKDVAAFRRLSAKKQRNTAFELMRRAEIRFHRDRVVKEHEDAVPARDDFDRIACPTEVIEAARASFGISILTGATPRK